MSTFIVTWNPAKWPHHDQDRDARRSAKGRRIKGQWSIGNRRQGITPGDRAFFLRQGTNRRGICASGVFTSAAYQDLHWDDSGRLSNYAKFAWEVAVTIEDRLPTEELLRQVPGVAWDYMQASGQQIYPPHDGDLEALWAAHLRALRASDARC